MLNAQADNQKGDTFGYLEKEFDSGQLELLKRSTTVFFLNDTISDNSKSIMEAIRSVWNITPIIFSPWSKYDDFNYNDYTFIIIRGDMTGGYAETRFYLILSKYFNAVGKKGKTEVDEIKYCRIELFAEYETYTLIHIDKEKRIDILYNNGKFRNWTPAFLKLYLQDVQFELMKNHRRHLYKYFSNKTELSGLKEDTLYIPDYVFIKFGVFTFTSELDPVPVRNDVKTLAF